MNVQRQVTGEEREKFWLHPDTLVVYALRPMTWRVSLDTRKSY